MRVTLILLTLLNFNYIDFPTWIKYTSEEADFEVKLPRFPQINTTTTSSDLGNLKIKVHLVENPEFKSGEDNLLYMIKHTDYPNEVAKLIQSDYYIEFYKESRDEIVNSVRGKLTQEVIVKVNGFEWFEFRVNYENYQSRVRFGMKGARFYVVQVVSHYDGLDNQEALNFLNSFTLL